jgi:putative membrane protein
MTIIISSALVASLLHFLFFALESLLWGSKSVCRIFGVTPEIASSRIVKSFAFNQGFYNLFLSLGAAWSAFQLGIGQNSYALVLSFCCLSMVGAALALFISSPKKIVAVLIQGGPPAVCLWALNQGGFFP